MQKSFYLFGVLGILITAPLFALGAVFEAKKDSYTLPEGEVLKENAYIASEKVSAEGSVEKDILTIASEAFFSGTIGEDLLFLGGKLFVSGPVAGDVRFASAEATLSSVVGGDVVALGARILLSEDSLVGGEVALMGSEVRFEGVAERDMKIVAERVYISGSVFGNVTVSAKELVITEDAFIEGTLTYPKSTLATVSPLATIGGDIVIAGRASSVAEGGMFISFLALAGLFVVTQVLVKLLTALLLYWRFADISAGLSEVALRSFGRYTFIGLLVLVGVPILSFLFLISFVGWMIGVLMLLLYVMLLILSVVYTGIMFGALLAKIALREFVVDWRFILLGVLSLELLILVPFVGWAIFSIFFLASLGVWSAMLYRKILK